MLESRCSGIKGISLCNLLATGATWLLAGFCLPGCKINLGSNWTNSFF